MNSTVFSNLKPLDHPSYKTGQYISTEANYLQSYQADLQLKQSEAVLKELTGLDTASIEEFFEEFNTVKKRNKKKYSDFQYEYGVDTDDLGEKYKSRANLAANNFVSQRKTLLANLLNVFNQSPNLGDLQNFFTIANNAHITSGGSSDTESPYYLEAQAAAKKAVAGDKILEKILRKDPKAFLYNPLIRGKLVSELKRRGKALAALDLEAQNNSDRGWRGKAVDFGFKESFSAASLMGAIGWGARKKVLDKEIMKKSHLLANQALHSGGGLSSLMAKHSSNGSSWLMTRARAVMGDTAYNNVFSNAAKFQPGDKTVCGKTLNHVDDMIKYSLKAGVKDNKTWASFGRTLLKYGGRRLPWIGPLVVAAGAWLHMKHEDNPKFFEPVLKPIAATTMFAMDYIIPDVGILFGSPFKPAIREFFTGSNEVIA